MHGFIGITLATVLGLLPIANPLSTATLFVAITKGFSKKRKDEQALRACLYMVGILVLFLVAGTLILKFFGISLSALRIAGGLIVAKIGFTMMTPASFDPVAPESKRAAVRMADVSFTPLAMPSLSGPGSIAVVLGMAPSVGHWWEYVAIILGISIVAAISWGVLSAADRIIKYIGVAGLNAFTRMMGFILVCVGIQFIVEGIRGFGPLLQV